MIFKLRNDGGLVSFDSAVSDFYEATEFIDNGTLTRDIIPAVNIYEDEDEYTIEVAMPGMDREDFSVQVSDGILTISADAEVDEEETDGGYTYREYNYSSFSRSFPLPDDAVKEGIDASYEKGELIITIPKTLEWVSSGYEVEIG